ncbi:MAG: MmgE/PrpD family protein [Ruminococcaceae bacterium]|jgi:2-methylcitrate dehydratase PrpD|nr:MmgE/PrpD family protein [Oscillospiraceae bacterium]
MNDTERICNLVCELLREELPDRILGEVKACILDYLGVTFAGARELSKELKAYLSSLSGEGGGAKAIGLGITAPAEDAAFVNGVSSHMSELDDGCRFGMVHVGAPVLSALFSLAGCIEITPDAFLRAVLVGYEVTIRLAATIQPGHKLKGFHATGTCGCVGAAAAAAVALGVPADRLKSVISAAAASASGLLEMMDDPSQMKPFNVGKAAQNGIVAARFGSLGLLGPNDPVGGRRGLFCNMAGEVHDGWFDREDGKKYMISSAYKKPYSSCRHCHSAVEAALTIAEAPDFCSKDIERVVVSTYGLAVAGHDHTDIISASSAKMSIPYSVAAALVLKTGGAEAMTEQMVRNPSILELTNRVSVVEEPEYSEQVPAKRIAKVDAIMKNGEVFSQKVEYSKGEPENPMTRTDLENKFMQLALSAGIMPERCRKIIAAVDELDQTDHGLQSLYELL